MKYRSLFLISFFALFFTTSNAQPQLEWAEPVIDASYLSWNLKYLDVVAHPDDGVYVIASDHYGTDETLLVGRSEVPVVGMPWDDYPIIRLDANGNCLWAKKYTGYAKSAGNDVDVPRLVTRPDGGAYIVSAAAPNTTITFGHDTIGVVGSRFALLITSINGNGEVINSFLLPTNTTEFHLSRLARNGDLIIAGKSNEFSIMIGDQTRSFNPGPTKFVARINPESEEVIWLKAFDAQLDWFNLGTTYGMLETQTGDVVITLNPAGFSYRVLGCREPGNLLGIRVAKLDGQTGALIWLRNVLSHGFGFVTGMEENEEGDLLLVGRAGGDITAENGEGVFINIQNCNIVTGFTMRLRADGTLYDIKTQEDGFLPDEIILFPDGDYAVLGYNEGWVQPGAEGTGNKAELRQYSRFDQLLGTISLPTVQSYTSPFAYLSMTRARGSGKAVYVSGLYRSRDNQYNFELSDVNIFSEVGFVARYELQEVEQSPLSLSAAETIIFPNPTTGFLNIRIEGGSTKGWDVIITDMSGRRVGQDLFQFNRSQETLDLSGLPVGLYQITLSDGQQQITKRVMVK